MDYVISQELLDACLQASAKSGWLSLTKELLSKGANPDASLGVAFVIASTYGNEDVAKVLEEAMISRSQKNASKTLPRPEKFLG